MAFALEPLILPNTKPNVFAVLDIEAHKWINFKVLGFYDGEIFQEFRDLGEFFDFLVYEYSEQFDGDKKGKKKFKIFAHFGGKYDFNFLLEWLCVHAGKEWEVGELLPRGSGLLCFDAYFRKKTKDGKYFDIAVSFYDSSALLPFSLANLTKSFDVPHKKGHVDFEKWDGKVTPDIIEYLKDDCRGLYEVLERFYNWPLIQFSGPSVTMASQALKVFRTFMEKPIYPLSKSADEFVRRAYFGGRTEIFKPYFESDGKQMLKAWDVNSLYPSVMMDFAYPGNMDSFTYDYDPKAFGFFEAEVEVPDDMYVPPLGTIIEVPTEVKDNKGRVKVVSSKKFVFPTGRFSGYWSTKELEYARSVGVKIRKTGKGVIFKSAGFLFKDYIEQLYKMRLDAKKKGDGVTDILAKLLMNSTYGRFGLNTERESLVIDSGQEGVIPDLEMKLGKGKVFRLAREPKELNTFTNVGISAWVTSLARIRMHEFYMKCGENLWYTDTDSLYTTKSFKDSGKLGELKFEGEFKKACFLLPKTYALESENEKHELVKKITMKGFDRKKIANFTVDDFLTALEGDMRLISAKQPEKFSTFRTAMRKGKFLAMMEESDRTLKTKYDKRRIVKTRNGYDTIPLHIRNGEILK